MAHYMIEVGYTPQAWSSQIDTQPNVIDRITPAVKAAKGRIESIYYAFGEADLVGIIDFPTPEDAAGFALAVTGTQYQTRCDEVHGPTCFQTSLL